MDKKQRNISACLDALAEYAAENKLAMRIMDELETCKRKVSSPDVDWDEMNPAIEDLFDSIEQKTVPQDVWDMNGENKISLKTVEAQIKKIVQRCFAEDTVSVESMTERKNVVVKKNCEQLTEITHAKAHLEEFKNEELYLQFFQTCRKAYERDCFEMFRELLLSVSGNYNHMLHHLQSMFQSIGGYKNGIGNEKFYTLYEEQRLGIDQRVQGEAQTADIGGDAIISLGQRTKEKIKKIVKKLTRKRKLFAWLPVIILFCFFAFATINQRIEKQDNVNQTEDSAGSKYSLLDQVLNHALDSANSAYAAKEPNGFESLGVLIKVLLLILIILVIALFYKYYLKKIEDWWNHQICRHCGEYLKTELFRFEQENEFSLKLDTVMKNIAGEYERQYMDVLNQLFHETQYHAYDREASEAAKLTELRDRWNQIKSE